MKTCVAIIILCLSFIFTAPSHATGTGHYYSGIFLTFIQTETYSSVLGGSVAHLEAAGLDDFGAIRQGILISGVISQETYVHVERLSREKYVKEVFLNSEGGDLLAGLALGRLFKERKLDTRVMAKAKCLSACALAFLGGVSRYIADDVDSFGFHRQYRIKNKQILYGDPVADTKLIDAYLHSVDFYGIMANEIVATTGLMEFSINALIRRDILTMDDAFADRISVELISETGVTPYEAIVTACNQYRGISSLNHPDSHISLSCAATIPPLRLPMLVRSKAVPTNHSDEVKDVLFRAIMAIREMKDPLEKNKFWDGYEAYKKARLGE